MKNIVYLCNYMLEDIKKQRNNLSVFSQAGNNKMKLIYEALKSNDCNVKIISPGWVNNNNMNVYKGFKSKIDGDITYLNIIDIKILKIIASVYFGYKEVKRLSRKEKIDAIIFYNYTPETACTAYLCKKILKVPIIVEYEDGMYNLKENNSVKKLIYQYIEKKINKLIDGAILVTSCLENRVKCKSVIVRGVINKEIMMIPKKVKKNKIPVIMYSGGLEKIRGIEILLNSLKYISSQFRLIITGKGECEDMLLNYNDDRVEFLGYIPYSDVIKNMINADILVNCQLENDKFGLTSFPSKIFEYMATENIVISSSVSDVQDFIGELALIYKNDDPKELAQKIDEAINLVNNEEKLNQLRHKMGKFNKENSTENIGKKVLSIL